MIIVGRLEHHVADFDGWFTLGGVGFREKELSRLATLDMYLLYGDV